jgi:tRNA(His) guanylyltransferase
MVSSLGDRMKGYEHVNRSFLIRRMPVVIRLDGKAFHTYTKHLDRPYSTALYDARRTTLEYLCNNIQGVLIGYSQSDEISLVLKDWTTLKTEAWFDGNLQKICSVSASMCTMIWNQISTGGVSLTPNALFDSRVFNLPREEVVNYLLWRQQDWERNSVQMLAQSLYSHKELQGKSCPELITKIEEEFGIIWGNLEPWCKQGEVWYGGGIQENFLFKEKRSKIDAALNLEMV